MQTVLMAAALAVPSAAHAADKQEKRKVKWTEVAALEKAPDGCEYLQKIDVDKSSFFTFTGKQMRTRLAKKTRKEVAKLGGNAYLVTDTMDAPGGRSIEAKAFWCETMPADAAFDEHKKN
jgi:hypothetical protein